MKIRWSDPAYEESLVMGMSPAQREVFDVIDESWKRYGLPTLKRPLSRSEIRRRVAGAPPSKVMLAQLLKTVDQLRKENACLKKKLGC